MPKTDIIALHRYKKEERRLISYVAKNVSLFFADFNTESPLKAGEYGFIRCKSPSLTNGYFDPMTRDIIAATDDNG